MSQFITIATGMKIQARLVGGVISNFRVLGSSPPSKATVHRANPRKERTRWMRLVWMSFDA
jgi:hypothetical protein